MKVTLNTKFDIGDPVYTVERYYDYFYANTIPGIVSGITINISQQDVRITYHIDQEGFTHRISEDWLFATYEECTKWCEEHNQSL